MSVDAMQNASSPTYRRSLIRRMVCPHCGGESHLVMRAPHPLLGEQAELRSFECVECLKATEVTVRL
jgi:hypothetical protein